MRLNRSLLTAFRYALASAALFLAIGPGTSAQALLPGQKEEEKSDSFAEEMRAKRQISYAQKEYKENLNRAQEVSCLGAEIGSTFKQKNQLDRSDLKKLDKIEKLTKSIRSNAGGSDDPNDLEELPSDLPAVITKMTEVTEALKTQVEKTPRRVISATVIDQANVLLELIRRVRGLSART